MSLDFDSLALPVLPGYRVGPWEVGEPLATSAFSTVYSAEPAPRASQPAGTADTGADTGPAEPIGPMEPTGPVRAPGTTVLKFLPPGTRTQHQLGQLRAVAEREPAVLRRTGAPRLIRTHAVHTVHDPGEPLLHGATVLVMERAERSLGDLLQQSARPAAGPALLAQVCAGLRQLHHAGWVHGALHPGNVLLLPDGTVRLGDFHLATEPRRGARGGPSALSGYAPALRITDCTAPELLWSHDRPHGDAPGGPRGGPRTGRRTGSATGSARGERILPLTPTADLWAFGVLVHLVLTGSPPLPGPTPGARRDAAVRYARGEGDLLLSPGLPPAWADVVRDCLARTPGERARIDTGELLRRVEAAAGTAPSPPLPRKTLLRPRSRSGSTAAWGTATVWGTAVSVAMAGVLAGVLLRGAPTAEAAGYDRCARGDVCFFTEPDGQGEMCTWHEGGGRGKGADRGRPGPDPCVWGLLGAPKSVLNNGDRDEQPHARFYRNTGFRQSAGCLQPLERRNLNGRVTVRSVKWLPSC
ncbi:protein kinase [Streptomyces sp. NPDC000594]|uniref:serine/threonine protein kinase n=1 Tax=Streptomyces sp. NPDC000594 TaxID=3154261 RepID=UPI0033165E50